MLFHQDILNGFQVIERALFCNRTATYKYVKIQYPDQKCDINDGFWNCFNHSIQCVILSLKDSYVQNIIVKDSS